MKKAITYIPDMNTICLAGHRCIAAKVAVVCGIYGLVVCCGLLGESAAEMQLEWLADGRAHRRV